MLPLAPLEDICVSISAGRLQNNARISYPATLWPDHWHLDETLETELYKPCWYLQQSLQGRRAEGNVVCRKNIIIYRHSPLRISR